MSFFGDLTFFIYLFAALIPAVILGICQKPLKQYALFISLIFIALIYGPNKKQLLFLCLYYFIQIHTIKIYLLLRKKFGRNAVIYGHFLLLALLPLLLCKISGLFHHNIFGFLGISYLTFRVLQIIIEMYDGVIKEISLFDLSSFLLFFPTISSGPIDRSRRFSTDLNTVYTRSEYLDMLGTGLQKLLLGIAYKFVFSAIFSDIMLKFDGRYRPLYILGYAYSYGFYMFFDFAGYSLMAIGVSYILGIKTPDNFRLPFISINIKDFWNRWHISLSHWFRDFIFSRFMMKSIKKKWFHNRLTGASVAFIVNMLIMGLWHGITSYYILYGLYHGVLLALTEIYQKRSKFYSKHKNNRIYKTVTWFITLNAVMFGFLIFSGKLNEIAHVAVTMLF